MSTARKTIQDISLAADWELKWGLPSFTLLMCSSLGHYYYYAVRERYGNSLSHVVFIYRDGQVNCYQSKKENEVFGAGIAHEFLQSPMLAADLLQEMKNRTGRLRDLMRRPLADFAAHAGYKEYDDEHYNYLPPYIAVTRAANCLPGTAPAEILNALREARIYTEPVYDERNVFMINLLDFLAQRIGWSAPDFRLIYRDELMAFLEDKDLPPPDELSKRKFSGLYFCSGQAEFMSEADCQTFVTAVADAQNTAQKQDSRGIIGQTASPGQATGRVRVVFNPSEPGDFQAGDILVTTMTRPAFVPLMKLAGAIVTDAGGVLCHAAIVSRELGKPCVIGTQIATQILRDGDAVEVDADAGSVTIIKRV